MIEAKSLSHNKTVFKPRAAQHTQHGFQPGHYEGLMPDYTPASSWRSAAARKINDGEIVFCGTGISMAGRHGGQAHLRPNRSSSSRPARSTPSSRRSHGRGRPRVMLGASSNSGWRIPSPSCRTRPRAARGRHPGCGPDRQVRQPQLHRHRDYFHPQVRFSAAAGPATWPRCRPHHHLHAARAPQFVKRWTTSPAPAAGGSGSARRSAFRQRPRPSSPTGVMGFDDTTKEMFLEAYFPGASPQKSSKTWSSRWTSPGHASWSRLGAGARILRDSGRPPAADIGIMTIQMLTSYSESTIRLFFTVKTCYT